jgi:hypothetical protein
MVMQETIKGKTPKGGVQSTAYYLDSKGNPIEKEEATRMEIIEEDSGGNVIARTYGTIG